MVVLSIRQIVVFASCFFLLGACQTTHQPASPNASLLSVDSEDMAMGGVDDVEEATFIIPSNEPVLVSDQILIIAVMGEEELSGTYPISSAGDIVFPLIGNLMVQGQTPSQVQDLITTQLQDGYIKNPFVQVRLKSDLLLHPRGRK